MFLDILEEYQVTFWVVRWGTKCYLKTKKSFHPPWQLPNDHFLKEKYVSTCLMHINLGGKMLADFD